MAPGFIGMSVTVTLKLPPNIVQGLVAHIDPQTSRLTLENVVFPTTGHRIDRYTVEGPSIADIKVEQHPAQNYALPQPPSGATHAKSHSIPTHPMNPQPQPKQMSNVDPPLQPARSRQPFVDPAILSMGKRPSMATATATEVAANQTPIILQEAPATPVKPAQPATTIAIASKVSPYIGPAKGISTTDHAKQNDNLAATLTAPFSGMVMSTQGENAEGQDTKESARRASVSKTRTGKPMESPGKPGDGSKRTRRGGKGRKKDQAVQGSVAIPAGLETSPEVIRKASANGAYRTKGWRQTPLLQDQFSDQARTPGIIGGKVGLEAVSSSNRKARRQKALEAKSGWATEDATDIQELPDFDFQGNLSKFDKQSIFDQIKNEDTTADEDRLVSFNRLPARPGTHGGKNLHPTENVLDPQRTRIRSDEFSDTEDEDDSTFGSGRNSRRAMSRTSTMRKPFRQGSTSMQDDGLHPSAPALLNRPNRPINRAVYSSSHVSGSPKPSRLTPPGSPLLEPHNRSSCLRLVGSNRVCHTISPGAMVAVEESAENDFGLSEEIMAENAGRGIAEVALSAVNPGGRRLARENLQLNTKPVVVILAGNHRSGARAVSASRHLQARGVRVMVFLLGFERREDWDKDVRRQVDLFRKLGGYCKDWSAVEGSLKRLEAPPELIIDALLGRHKEFEALGEDDRSTVLKVVGWANKSRASVLAVEMPSGVAGSSGEVAILEGEPLEVRAKYIVCLGAPRLGLLRALQSGAAGREPPWLIWIVDIGLNKAWKRAGIVPPGGGIGAGIPFGADWIVQARFVEEDASIGNGNGDAVTGLGLK